MGLNPLDACLPLLTQLPEYLFTVRKVGLRTIKNYSHRLLLDVGCGVRDRGCGSGIEGSVQRVCQGGTGTQEACGRLGRVFCFTVLKISEVRELEPSFR